MTTALALDLSHDGIRLLRRSGEAWEDLGGVVLDDPEMGTRLAELRDRAVEVAGEAFTTELIIPPSQILYTTLDLGDGPIRDEDVRAALGGMTPVPVEELAFDWRRDGGVVRVAALELTTLREAEDFAVQNGFNPVRFTARPEPAQFPEPPDFGPTQAAAPEVPASAAATAPPAAPPDKPRRQVPWAVPEPGRNPGPVVIIALIIAAALVWGIYYLVQPESDAPPVEIGFQPEEAPEETTPPEDVAEVPATPVETVEPPTEVVEETPAPVPPDLADTPEAGSDPEAASPAQSPAGKPEPRREAAVPALPAEGKPVSKALMAERSEAVSAPSPERYRLSAEEWQELLARNPIRAEDIWQIPPPPPLEPLSSTGEEIYLASIDPDTALGDPVALPPPEPRHGRPPALPDLPAPGTEFVLDERGLVEATPEGALTPDGIVVTLGKPDIVPPERPVELITVSPADAALALALRDKRPRPRPENFADSAERSQLGGRTISELSGIRPRPRPESPQVAAEAVAAAVAEANAGISPNAVAVSRAPAPRPANFAKTVEAVIAARKRDEASAVSAAVVPQPSRQPTVSSVARQATIEDAIQLRDINLIGVYGSKSDRRALVRLSNGRYVKVRVGDRLDGGQVSAIGTTALQYVKNGKTIVLEIPSG